MVKAESLSIGYGNYLAVNNIDLEIDKKQITTIIGPNGSGKSTILKALTRLISYKSGNIIIDNCNLKEINSKNLAKKIGVLPQYHSAPPDFKVKDLVGYGRLPYQKWYKSNSDEDDKIIDWAMKVSGVYHLKEKSINACSGGEAQRVWIATVLTQKPQMLFLDEPTTYLDIAYQIETMKLVKKLNRESGIGIVMVLHDISQALEISDKIIIVKDGKIYSEGSPKKVITTKMMKDVYGVDCDMIKLDDRCKPIIAYKEIL